MSDQEFDNYLTLLSRLLKLGDKQRQAIAGELRSHLEDRLEELLARGMPRDEAVRQALAEFGDAAGLAAEFVSLSGNKRKRWLMRLTTASVAATVLIAAGIFTFWPGHNAGPGAATLVAQAPDATPADAAQKAKPAGDQKKAASIKETLERRMAFEFTEKPLVEVVKLLSEQAGITVYLDAKELEEAGVNIDTPITKTSRDIRLRTFLDLMLGELELTYMVLDDVLLITTPEHAESPDRHVVRVYDCRELLALARPPGSTRTRRVPTAGGGGFFAVQDQPPAKAPQANPEKANPEPAEPANRDESGSTKSSAGGGFGVTGGDDAKQFLEVSDVENLIGVITSIVNPESWTEVGGPGSIAEYKGLITVASTQKVHEKVERLLNMLHQAANLKEPKVTVVE